jgi:hypothetical protein
MIAQAVMFGFRIGEISCPTLYFKDASSINFSRSVTYGLGVLSTTATFVAHKLGFIHSAIFNKEGRKVCGKLGPVENLDELLYYSEAVSGS